MPMSDDPERDSREAPQAGEPAAARGRTCLRCLTPFQSAWAGERICARCKDSVAWRQGLPYRSGAADRRR